MDIHIPKPSLLWPSVIAPAGQTSNARVEQRQRLHWSSLLGQDVLSLERTRECFDLIEGDPMLAYDLPKKPRPLPGHVLKHCYGVVDKILQAQAPCVYKVGYTHCAYFRFHNRKFGYAHEKQRWQQMIVIYAASEPISPGFVEAAIIQRHKGSSNAKNANHICFLNFKNDRCIYVQFISVLLRTTGVSKSSRWRRNYRF